MPDTVLKAGEEIELRHAQAQDEEPFYYMMKENLERLREAFPQSIRAAGSLASAREYLADLKRGEEERMVFHFFILYKGQLAGAVYVKNIDWDVPKCELAYFLGAMAEGKGIMKKALCAVAGWCFSVLKMNRLLVRVAVSNLRSRHVAEACGFEQEGLLRKDFRAGTGELQDVIYYGIVKEEASAVP